MRTAAYLERDDDVTLLRVGVGPVEYRAPSPLVLGDGVVPAESAAAGGANGPGLIVRCDADPDIALPLEVIYLNPCRHSALPNHPSVVADVRAEVTAAAGSSLAAAGSPADLDAVDLQILGLQLGQSGNFARCGDTVIFVGTIENSTAGNIPAPVMFTVRGDDTANDRNETQQVVVPPGRSEYRLEVRVLGGATDLAVYQVSFAVPVNGTGAVSTTLAVGCHSE